MIEGIWEGNLSLGNGEIRLVFHISADEDGGLSSKIDSPDQGANGIPVASTSFADGSLNLEVSAVGGQYTGTLSEDAQTLSGTWSQGGMELPLNMSKTDKPTELNRPQEPERPYPYDEEEVFFENESDDVRLAGTLTKPKSAGPFPAVVLISGSGPQNRDEELMGHKPFLILSDYLTRQGLAVLRYDDRGTAESTGSFGTATSVDLANDVQAAVDFLKKREDIDNENIGLAGHSEGGLIAPMLATETGNVAFIVLMAGPGLPGDEILRLQGTLLARAGGMAEPMLKQMEMVNSRLYAAAKEAPDDQVKTSLEEEIASIKQDVDASTLTALGLSPDREGQIIQQLSSPWFQYFLRYDPVPTLKKVKVPTLSVIGAKDLQVPAPKNTEAIKAAFTGDHAELLTAEILPDLNHLFQTADTGAMSEYGQIEETMSPIALSKIGDWIKRQVTE